MFLTSFKYFLQCVFFNSHPCTAVLPCCNEVSIPGHQCRLDLQVVWWPASARSLRALLMETSAMTSQAAIFLVAAIGSKKMHWRHWRPTTGLCSTYVAFCQFIKDLQNSKILQLQTLVFRLGEPLCCLLRGAQRRCICQLLGWRTGQRFALVWLCQFGLQTWGDRWSHRCGRMEHLRSDSLPDGPQHPPSTRLP